MVLLVRVGVGWRKYFGTACKWLLMGETRFGQRKDATCVKYLRTDRNSSTSSAVRPRKSWQDTS